MPGSAGAHVGGWVPSNLYDLGPASVVLCIYCADPAQYLAGEETMGDGVDENRFDT